jgi:hypothetical protein
MIFWRSALVALAFACLVGAPVVTGADVIELTNGVRIVGEVKNATLTAVTIQVQGKEVRIQPKLVRSITFGDGQDVAPPSQVTPPVSTVPASVPAPPLAPASPPGPSIAATPIAPPPTPPTPPAPPLPRPLSPQVAAALALLDKLQAATEKMLAPADYAARVEQVRRDVEDALAAAPDEADVRRAITTAVHYHEFAAFAGAVYEERGDLALIGRDPVIVECRALSEQISRDATRLRMNPADPSVAGLFAATEGAPPLRACAGEKIGEAESRARAPR